MPAGEEHLAQDGSATSIETTSNATDDPTNHQAVDDDPWGDVRDEHFGDTEVDENGEPIDGADSDPEQAASGDDSHLENTDGEDQDQTQDEEAASDSGEDSGEFDIKYNLDDLKLPHKYKPFVDAKVKAILGDASKKHSELVKGHQESNAAFAGAFNDILASDKPVELLHDYVKQVATGLGRPELLTQFEAKIGHAKGDAGKPVPAEGDALNFNSPDVQAKVSTALGNIENKYWAAIDAAPDTATARKLYSQMEREKLALTSAVNQAQMKAVLMAFHQKFVKPTHEEFGKIKADSEQQQAIVAHSHKISLWKSADQEMTKAHPDWPKYRAEVKALIKSDRYTPNRKHINNTESGHVELMKDLYLVASRQDHLANAKRPKRPGGAARPTGKHIQTQQSGGSDWADIGRDLWNVNPDE